MGFRSLACSRLTGSRGGRGPIGLTDTKSDSSGSVQAGRRPAWGSTFRARTSGRVQVTLGFGDGGRPDASTTDVRPPISAFGFELTGRVRSPRARVRGRERPGRPPSVRFRQVGVPLGARLSERDRPDASR